MTETNNKKGKSIDLVHSAVLSSFRTLQDGTLKIELSLNEMTPEQSMKIFQLHNKYVKFLLSNNKISEDKQNVINNLELDAPKSKVKKGGKTPQQKLRNTMFVFYNKKYGTEDKFDEWYENQTESIRQKYLIAIDELNEE